MALATDSLANGLPTKSLEPFAREALANRPLARQSLAEAPAINRLAPLARDSLLKGLYDTYLTSNFESVVGIRCALRIHPTFSVRLL